eukprot:tig00020710_g13237.t1
MSGAAALASFMGQILERFFGKSRFSCGLDYRILLLGLDNAGKTTILYKLRMGEVVTTTPTIGFNVETIVHKNVHFTAWDVGGQEKLRPLWRHYFSGTHAVIYVVDAADAARIDEARGELARLLAAPELEGAAILVLANKQDLPGALPAADLAGRLELPTIRRSLVQGCCANSKSGEGLPVPPSNASAWQSWIVTYDGPARTLSLYYGSALVASGPGSGSAGGGSAQGAPRVPESAGGDVFVGLPEPFTLGLDNIRMWSVAVSASDVRAFVEEASDQNADRYRDLLAAFFWAREGVPERTCAYTLSPSAAFARSDGAAAPTVQEI